MKNVIYDFLWDDQGDLGVWVTPRGGGEPVLVEAMVVSARADEAGYHEPTGEYVLASHVELESGDGVWVENARPVFGSQAQSVLARLVATERAGRQIPVNEQQEALLGRAVGT